ncbi:MAG: ribosome small subunit-dependent GTPase A, partial [Burkholderiaceae bacterium]|nr:ribosome small subunit-dependent GTPase A [Burkholderiaceae bacterium]
MSISRALLIASYGRHYLAQTLHPDGATCPSHSGPLIEVTTPGKRHLGAVGDILQLENSSTTQARL